MTNIPSPRRIGIKGSPYVTFKEFVMRSFGILAVLFLVAQTADADFAEIDFAVNASIDKGELPGAVVLVLHHDKIAYKKSFGQRMKLPEPTLMSDDTVFDLA